MSEIDPVLAELARMRATDSKRVAIDQGTVTSVDHGSGRCRVTLDSGAVDAPAMCAGTLPAPRERVWVQFVPPSGYVITGRVHGQPGLLGYAPPVVADVLVPAASSVIVCSASVVVQTDRVIRISAHIGQVLETGGASQGLAAWIAEGGVQQAVVARHDVAALSSASFDGQIPLFGPVFGAHVYDLVVGTATGTATVLAQPLGIQPGPATLVVEDVGSALS